MSEVTNSERLLNIREILITQTDEDHELSLKQIIQQLHLRFGNDYPAQKNTIKKMIGELNDGGFHVEEHIGKRKTAYYSHQDRKFEVHELRMLIDAVSSARFITAMESKKLINKIKTLTSIHLAKRLHHQISVATDVKAQNQEVRYHIDKIHTAINDQKRINFKYGNYNVKKEFILRHQGKIYSEIPLSLVWNNDYYYLVAKNEPTAEIKHYRVDRMKMASVSENQFVPSDFNISEHMNHTFNMYPGDITYTEIKFDNHLINVVIDRFGKDINIHIEDDHSFSIKVKAAISEGLIRWILTWGSDAKVVSPQTLVERVKAEAKKMNELYS
jgi:predicted DNA-binding transcriptional regulator YafY